MGAFLCLCFLGTNFWELFDPVICCVVITLCLPGFDLVLLMRLPACPLGVV